MWRVSPAEFGNVKGYANMQCLVINLDRSLDRMRHMNDQFAGLGRKFKRVVGCDAKAVDEADLFPLKCQDNSYRDMTAGEIACFLSHRKCWEIAANSDDEYTAIFEDDVYLSKNAEVFLNDENWIIHGAKCIKIETLNHSVVQSRKKHQLQKGYTLHQLVSVHYGSAGYIISKEYAKELINKSMPIPCITDEFLFGRAYMAKKEKNIYQMAPAICIQSRILNEDNSEFETLIMDYTDWDNSQKPIKIKKTILEKLNREIIRFCKNIPKLHRILYDAVFYKKETINFK